MSPGRDTWAVSLEQTELTDCDPVHTLQTVIVIDVSEMLMLRWQYSYTYVLS